MSRVIEMGSWIEQGDDTPHCIWGTGLEILWGDGEATMIAGDQGTGKTTLAGTLVAGLIGVPGYEKLFGFDITAMPEGEKLLYLAMDRPKQVRRAFKRNLHGHASLVNERAVVAYGPLLRFKKPGKDGQPAEWMTRGETLLHLCAKYKVSYLVVDSLKDLVIGVTGDETAAQWNADLQALIASGVNVLILHHDRKSQVLKSGDRVPKSLDSIYGSVWITSGLGSVIHLEKTGTEDHVRVRHFKPIIDPFKAFEARLDRKAGMGYRVGSAADDTLLSVLTSERLSTAEIMEKLGRIGDTGKRQTLRELNKLQETGRIRKHAGANGKSASWSLSQLGPGFFEDEIVFDDEAGEESG